MTFRELQESLHILGLEDRITMAKVKERHRQLVKRYHPDTGTESNADEIQRINGAYTVVSEYLEGYRYSFSEDEFYTQNPEENMRRQFMDDSLWGSGR